MAFAKFADLARQKFERQRLAAGDAHRSAPHAFEVLDLRFHPLDIAVLPPQIVDEHLARGGEPHAARPALEQLGAEFLFQVHDAAVHRGGGDVEMIGRLADRAGARNLVDIARDA